MPLAALQAFMPQLVYRGVKTRLAGQASVVVSTEDASASSSGFHASSGFQNLVASAGSHATAGSPESGASGCSSVSCSSKEATGPFLIPGNVPLISVLRLKQHVGEGVLFRLLLLRCSRSLG